MGSSLVVREGQIGPYGYTLTVDPARAGSNTTHVYLLDSTGGLAEVDEISLSATLPEQDVGPLEFAISPAGPGHATGVVRAAASRAVVVPARRPRGRVRRVER